ncbi:uncharacterized protein LOC120108813 isoform X3 [Phoenix dactylifera]|uniref:Uncharacterized protein LOC120108813 isoform X3 n=1 Tax=Phoenix dactylifera TaxID=42345 RepID=A0A8B8ZVZ2_PHODC|nr:uncharacterized protein LOC120108813 isoform X3 [Phoenix dactylifera]
MQDMCMLQPKFPPISNQPSSNWCPPHLNHIDNQGSAPTHMWTFESHDPAVGANHPLSLLTPTPRVIQMNSPSSVMECLPTMNQGASSLNPMTSYLDSTLNRMTQLCNQDIQSLRRVDDISERQIQQLPWDTCATPAPNFLPGRVSANTLLTHTAEQKISMSRDKVNHSRSI